MNENFELPSQEELNAYIAQAHVERAIAFRNALTAMRDGCVRFSDRIATALRPAAHS